MLFLERKPVSPDDYYNASPQFVESLTNNYLPKLQGEFLISNTSVINSSSVNYL